MKDLLEKYLDKPIFIKGVNSKNLQAGLLFIVTDDYCGVKDKIKSGEMNYYIPYLSISSITEAKIRTNQIERSRDGISLKKDEYLVISMSNPPFKLKTS